MDCIFNARSLSLKIGRNPEGKDHLPTIHLQLCWFWGLYSYYCLWTKPCSNVETVCNYLTIQSSFTANSNFLKKLFGEPIDFSGAGGTLNKKPETFYEAPSSWQRCLFYHPGDGTIPAYNFVLTKELPQQHEIIHPHKIPPPPVQSNMAKKRGLKI